MKYRVSAQEQGMSLASFLLARLEGKLSLKKIKQGIEGRGCKISDRVELFPSRKLMEGEVVEFAPPSTKEGASPRILFQTQDLLAIDKMPGMVCTPAEVKKLFPEASQVPILVHRLDKDTSGVLLLAKNETAAKRMEDLFLKRRIRKEYLALVAGKPATGKGRIDNYLGKIGGYQGQTTYGRTEASLGLRAVTDWELLGSKGGISLLMCRPLTGRTHQIRVHLSQMGCPILGDHQYAKKGSQGQFPRHLLHAYAVSWIDPQTGDPVEIRAPLPEDFLPLSKIVSQHTIELMY